MSEPWRTVLYVNQFGSVVHAPGPGIELVPVMPVSDPEAVAQRAARDYDHYVDGMPLLKPQSRNR